VPPYAGTLLGSREPTFAWAPPAHSNAAQEAIELMRDLGRPGDPWQCDVLHLWCGERSDGTWAAFECFVWVQRQNGKGWILEARELAGLFIWGERSIIHTAHRAATVQAHWRRVLELVEGSDDLMRRVRRISRKDGEEGIELKTGARLDFRVRSGGGGGRGLTGEVVVLDEALYLKAADLEALGPTMMAVPNAQIIYASTAPEKPAPGAPRPHIVDVRSRAHRREPRIAGAEWTNPHGTNVNDEAARARVNPAYGRRITPERMEDMRKLLGEEGFARECLGIWYSDGGLKWTVIPEAAWLAAEDPEAVISGPLVLGVAAQQPERSMVSIVACGRDRWGRRVVERTGRRVRQPDGTVVDRPDYRPGTRWVVPRLRELVRRHHPLVIVIDDRQLADEAEEAGLPVYRSTVGDMVSACGMFRAAVADPDPTKRDLVHLGQEDLTTAVAGAGTRDLAGLWAWDRRDPATDVTSLVAASLAVWGLSTPRIHIPSLQPFVLYGG